ncbi:MAG TPA: hypothetical protein VIS96_01010 [Terrimicrobiaceae bacterium]
MRVIPIRLAALILGLLMGGCSFGVEGGKGSEGTLLATSHNPRANLSVEFYGTWVGSDAAPREKWVVTRIAINDGSTGKKIRFTPDDPQTLRDSFGYFADVWSPDFNYLVLPLGRYEGFVVLPTGAVTKKLRKQGHGKIQIKLAGDDSPLLWHEFLGWQRHHLLRFSAGLSGDSVEFQYDPEAKTVYGLANTPASFRAISAMGEIPIKPLRR